MKWILALISGVILLATGEEILKEKHPVSIQVNPGPVLIVQVPPDPNNLGLLIQWMGATDLDRGDVSIQLREKEERSIFSVDLKGLTPGRYTGQAILFVIEHDGIRGKMAAPFYARQEFTVADK